ncbi:MAG: hypothetical protein M3Q94_01235 [Pseudomonadota bacterium]|nr:hypothetical protein [Pseudomonadota bacterium]
MRAATPSNAHTGTPVLQVSNARGLIVRTVAFHRREASVPIDTRVTQHRFDAVGRLLASRDPYLFDLASVDELAPFNHNQVTSLSGAALSTDSVDAGWRLGLPGAAGQVLETWDGRGSHAQCEFDELLRLAAIRERDQNVPQNVLERFSYADASAEASAHNLCGQLYRHDDPAGTVHLHELDLYGNVLSHTRRFLSSVASPNWPEALVERDALLQPGAGVTTANTYAPSGELLSQTDAMGNVQSLAYILDGQLKNTRLTLAGDGQVEKLIVSDLHYNASSLIESETAGNGVITRHHYDEVDGRLTERSAQKADGTLFHQLKYQYAAGGNVLSIEDAAQPIRYYNNQRIVPLKTYRYDTLGQLIEATGYEARSGSGGAALPDLQPLPPDPSQIACFTQTFHYDAAGNQLELVHVGAQAQASILARARYSNRCLPWRHGRPPTEEELAFGFDPNGNLCELQAGQTLTWDLRDQLREIFPVVRKDSDHDRECYSYDGGGQRVRKISSSLTNARTIVREVRYLPGLEIRSNSGTGEMLHIISANAGSNSVRILHWVSKRPEELVQDQMRFSLTDQVKSCTIELDQQANVISREEYYAFGGTALWAGRNATEAKYKTVRYSGKERDGWGLYYYRFRYYAPWLRRWINPDPAGNLDGLNQYQFVSADPVNYIDSVGLDKNRWQNLVHKHLMPGHGHILKGRGKEYMGEQINDPSRQTPDSRQYRGVRYYNQQQRIDRHMPHTVVDGLLRRVNGNIANYNLSGTTSSSSWLGSARYMGYVLAMNEQNEPELALFAPSRDHRHHSSAFSGRPVLDAGMIVVSVGGIAFLENKSGHYRPNIEQKLHTLNYLKKGGMNLKDIFVSEMIPEAVKFNRDDLEQFFISNLYNAEDIYNFYKDAGLRIDDGSNGEIARQTAAPEKPPVVYVPRKGKDRLTPMETLTSRNWSNRTKNGRPEKPLNSSRLSYI